jgi:hypothetical protein
MSDVGKAAAKIQIRLPGLAQGVGAGDVVRKLTEAVGIPHCSECDRRQERLNNLLRFERRLEEDHG